MIISNIIGGLGNQMFQYAAGLALSHARNTEFKLDLSYFKYYSLHHGYELEKVFNVTAKFASSKNFYNMLGFSGVPIVRRLFRRPSFLILRNSKHFVEPHQHFWIDFINLPNNVYLDGYWQTEKYFKNIDALVRKEFSFKTEMNTLNQSVTEQINNCNSISLHIRRGDYVSDQRNAFIGTCSIAYYQSAIQYMNLHTNSPHFFIFSDDFDWVKSNLSITNKHTFIEFNKGVDSYNDMRLMSLCKHHIIANSSFSWWGAWLNPSKNKIVIAPKQWFAFGHSDQDIVPDNWIKI